MKIRKMCILVSAATTNGYKTIPSFGPHPRRDLSHMYLSPSYSQSNSYQITPFHSLGCSDQVLPYDRVSLHNYFSHSLITLLLVLLCILFSLTFFLLSFSSLPPLFSFLLSFTSLRWRNGGGGSNRNWDCRGGGARGQGVCRDRYL